MGRRTGRTEALPGPRGRAMVVVEAQNYGYDNLRSL